MSRHLELPFLLYGQSNDYIRQRTYMWYERHFSKTRHPSSFLSIYIFWQMGITFGHQLSIYLEDTSTNPWSVTIRIRWAFREGKLFFYFFITNLIKSMQVVVIFVFTKLD